MDPSINDPASKIGQLFRRRFRVPYPLFKEVILEDCKRVNLFSTKNENMVRIPLEFKILMSLRILGRGNCMDDITELADIFESSAIC